MSVCLAASGKIVALALEAFALVWSHSVEKTEWREHWRVVEGGLVIERAEVEGTGAGMEIPEGAAFDGSAWSYRPDLPPQREVAFADAGRGQDWLICVDSRCREIGSLLPVSGTVLRISACDRSGQPLFDH